MTNTNSRDSVLVLDDEPRQRDILALILRGAGCEVTALGSPIEAIRVLETGAAFDIIVTDLRMPLMDGIEFLEKVRRIRPEQVVLVVTAHGSIPTAVQAMKMGAFHYLTKPLDREEFLVAVQRGLEHGRLLAENRLLQSQVQSKYSLRNMVGNHSSMQQLFRLVEKVAPTNTTVLIYGESGTGKELIARAIHLLSPRSQRAMQAINCAAIPETLLESELFGYEKGAFTGAEASRKGLFEQSSGTTLLLDEIGDLSLTMQAKILRVIQEREVQRLGGSQKLAIDTRIVSSTHRDLKKMVSEGAFREDLFYRLNTFPLRLPPLRERSSDIPLLAEHFLRKLGHLNPAVTGFTRAALQRLTAYTWPGNVRQLESVIERSIILAERPVVDAQDLPPDILETSSPIHSAFQLPAGGVNLEELEKHLIRQALERSGGVLAGAAPLLGLTYRTLQYRMQKYDIQAKRGEDG